MIFKGLLQHFKGIKFGIFILFLTAVFAHDKMTYPLSRTGVETSFSGFDAAVNPNNYGCDAPNRSASLTPQGTEAVSSYTIIPLGCAITVSWADNHNTGNIYVSWANYNSNDEVMNFMRVATAPDTQKTITTITAPTTPGQYTLQWIWDAGWINCHDFCVSATTPTTTTLSTNTITTTSTTTIPTTTIMPTCSVGSFGCTCTNGGGCDPGLICEQQNSIKICVLSTTKASSLSSMISNILLISLCMFCAIL